MGGGITRELMIYPEGSSLGERNFDFRISSAIIDLTESDFSDFSGYKRYILPVEGNVTLFRADEKIILSPDVPFLLMAVRQYIQRIAREQSTLMSSSARVIRSKWRLLMM